MGAQESCQYMGVNCSSASSYSPPIERLTQELPTQEVLIVEPVTALSCPGPTDDPVSFASNEGPQTILLSDPDTLCMLTYSRRVGRTPRIPVARSYQGEDWEKYNSDTAMSMADPLCDGSMCVLDLPVITRGTYQLTSVAYTPTSSLDPYARFLEKATFGGTYAEIVALEASGTSTGNTVDGLALAQWVQNQQDVVAPTFHRALYRERLTARFVTSTPMGQVSHPCAVGTFYRSFAFSEKDRANELVVSTVTRVGLAPLRVLWVNGVVRSALNFIDIGDDSAQVELPDGTYSFCDDTPEPFLGGAVAVVGPNGCQDIYFEGATGNPTVKLRGWDPPTLHLVYLDTHVIDTTILNMATSDIVRVERELDDPVCDSLVLTNGNAPTFFGVVNNGADLMLYDPRFEIHENTFSNPIPDGGGAVARATEGNPVFATLCANVARTPFNEDSCFLSTETSACTIREVPSIPVQLVRRTLRRFFRFSRRNREVPTRYVYAVEGLSIENDNTVELPCRPRSRSRWIPVPDKDASTCGATNGVDSTTAGRFVTLLDGNDDTNPNLRDIVFPDSVGFDCDAAALTSKGFEVYSATTGCWLNVHPDHLQVYDMTVWTILHPGGGDRITQFAQNREHILVFPYSTFHGMDRWNANKGRFYNLGRFGDTIDYRDLPPELQILSIDEQTSPDTGYTSGVVVCGGTEGEVANRPELGAGTYNEGAFDVNTDQRNATTPSFVLQDQSKLVWTSVALSAPDQLRQRVAWALSQIFAINPDDVGGVGSVEQYLAFYDIFVRNAFTNYRDVMREVAYSVPMAIMLTFIDSRSTAFEWRRAPGNIRFPDENFAREIMQLFTIGLEELNSDGTIKTDSRGRSIQTYTNDEIVEYARVWTGFSDQERRGNIEESSFRNRIDPMQIVGDWRDKFPKSGLGRKYIGEGYPLCIDFPSAHFLKRGAKFRLIGFGLPEDREYPLDWVSDPERVDVELTADTIGGSLYSKLCDPADPSDLSSCSYPATVTLVEDIACAEDDDRAECSVSNLDVVKLPSGVYYEYIRPPCVHQTFYESAKKIKQASPSGGFRYMCADPRAKVASIACCALGTTNAYLSEQVWAQRTDFTTAEDTCHTLSTNFGLPGGLCTRNILQLQNCVGGRCNLPSFHWTTRDCDLLVKIDSDLRVAIVHQTTDSRPDLLIDYVQQDTQTFFRVDWSREFDVTRVLNECVSTEGCFLSTDQYCTCRTTTVESAAFLVSIPDLGGMPSVEEVLDLTVGALEPDVYFGPSSYSQGTVDGVTIFYQEEVDEHSIFQVTDDTGRVHLRKNLQSRVLIGDDSPAFFRNPVQFYSLVDGDGERRDAEYETEAALDQYFYHRNVAPFVSYRLAQRFGISNPTPRYVQAIADAFRSGQYILEAGGQQVVFGTNEYGDMKATVAAILLDREATEVLLDADPTHGALREPLLKVTGLMRGFEFMPADMAPFPYLRNLEQRIGQMAHELPSVFSFFLPEYQPDGVVAEAGLVSPEAEAYSVPNLVDTINGQISLIKYGLDWCYGGFGAFRSNTMCYTRVVGEFDRSFGYLTHEPSPTANSAGTIAQELATLATSGRLSDSTRQLIQQIYDAEADKTIALLQMMQIVVSSPEFHATGLVTKSGAARPDLPVFMPTPGVAYKAVVFLLLRGGYDSFNLLVPDSGCTRLNAAGLDLRAQYEQVRGVLAFTDEERSQVIDFGEQTTQACRNWAIHPAMDLLYELWEGDDGGLAWFLNTGVLNDASTTADNFASVTATQLFAHNAMQEESQRLDPFDRNLRTGICGRAAAALDRRGFQSGVTSINNPAVAVNGGINGPIPATLSNRGPDPLLDRPNGELFDPKDHILTSNQAHDDTSSVFGETFSATLTRAFQETIFYEEALENTEPYLTEPDSFWERNMGIITQLMQTRNDRGVNRDFYFVDKGGWDHHAELKENLEERFTELNGELRLFVNELRDKGLWDKVTLVLASDFGRTLTPNSNEGSDHAWGGHYFVMGGSVKNQVVLGNYPDDITSEGPLNLGRGRIVPTQAWESMWNPVFHWMGTDPTADLGDIMPNAIRSGTPLYEKDDLFLPNT